MNKGQISFFIIIGIIILLVGSVTVYLTSQGDMVSEINVKEASIELFQSASVKRYVTSCLSNALSDGIITLGSHGGLILAGDSGSFFAKYPLLQPTTVNYSNVSVGVLIKSILYDFEDDFVYNGSPVRLGKSALPLVRTGPFSLEAQLSAYVLNQTSACINFSTFDKAITSSNLSIEVFINENDVSVVLDADVVIQDVPQNVIKGFVVKENTRLAKVHGFVSDIISNDISYLDFNMSADYIESGFWDEGIDLTVYYIAPNSSYDIIEVKDFASNLRGEPFTFIFARENRPPVLSYIDDSAGKFFAVDYDSDKVAVDPIVFDPDEDNLTVKVIWSKENGDFIKDDFTSPTIKACGDPCVANVTVNDSLFVDWQRVTFRGY